MTAKTANCLRYRETPPYQSKHNRKWIDKASSHVSSKTRRNQLHKTNTAIGQSEEMSAHKHRFKAELCVYNLIEKHYSKAFIYMSNER